MLKKDNPKLSNYESSIESISRIMSHCLSLYLYISEINELIYKYDNNQTLNVTNFCKAFSSTCFHCSFIPLLV